MTININKITILIKEIKHNINNENNKDDDDDDKKNITNISIIKKKKAPYDY